MTTVIQSSPNIASATKFFDFAQTNQLALVCVHKSAKNPVGDEWQDAWSKDRAVWEQWRAEGFNTGIHQGASGLVDFDLDAKHDGIGAVRAVFDQWMLSLGVGRLPHHVETPSSGQHVLMRLPEGTDPKTLKSDTRGTIVGKGIDVLTGNRQSVAPGSFFDGTAEGKPSGFYTFNDAPIYAAPPAVLAILKRRTIEVGSVSGAGKLSLDDGKAFYKWMADEKFIECDDDWREAGMCAKVEWGDDGLSVWKILATRSDDLDAKSLKRWNSFASEYRPGDVQIKTLMWRAHRAGWKGTVREEREMAGKMLASSGVTLPSVSGMATVAPLWKSAADLMAKTFPPVSYVVPKYVAEGCTLFAGRPKIGKSWMTEDMALAVAAGGEVLGEKVEQGDVLLLALEDNERRLQERFKKILGLFGRIPEALTYATEWKRVDEGGLEAIEAWIKAVKKPRLVVVDVLERVRPQQQGRKAQYEADYQAIAGLQRIASQHRIAIVIVHHVRKSASESGDAIDKISGTLGLSGAADSILILDRDGQGTKLYGRGRDVEEIDMAVTFDKGRCRWNVIGQAGEVRKSDERRLILDALNGSGTAMKRADIVAATGMKSNNVGYLLSKMMRDGDIERAPGGGYLTVAIPTNTANSANTLTSLKSNSVSRGIGGDSVLAGALTANIPRQQIIAPPTVYQRITSPPPMPPC
jgi:hypothetical protein